jgi:hypothetical protein
MSFTNISDFVIKNGKPVSCSLSRNEYKENQAIYDIPGRYCGPNNGDSQQLSTKSVSYEGLI